MNRKIVFVVEFQCVAGENANHRRNVLSVIGERIPALGVQGCMQSQRDDAIFRPYFRRQRGRNVQPPRRRHSRQKKARGTPSPDTHGIHLRFLSPETHPAIPERANSCFSSPSDTYRYPKSPLEESGRFRTRLPVAANMALQNAATNGGTPGSPTPAGGAELSTI